ncbi:hypothetical protein SLEP1_g38115 [Rubroshorea leprosula]|uniref:Uncharacterized protein n=1 Tax=Rubroshorea leprosula TaxID=152421 RepID=A0AAV5KX40_9ROSI|nr:hypothetical protein SLEP1_g38115 [Rubroshorea leprosula]
MEVPALVTLSKKSDHWLFTRKTRYVNPNLDGYYQAFISLFLPF